MQKRINQLTEDQVQLLVQNFEVLHFNHDFDVVYEHQIPNAGLILLEGEIELTKKSKVLKKILPFTLLGIHYLLNNKQVSMGCKVKKDSKIIMIGKSELMSVLENSQSRLFNIFKPAH
jgi:signal-transduction protein with cAMP-binding, CBS, and nucleotidyltransferase domain